MLDKKQVFVENIILLLKSILVCGDTMTSPIMMSSAVKLFGFVRILIEQSQSVRTSLVFEAAK